MKRIITAIIFCFCVVFSHAQSQALQQLEMDIQKLAAMKAMLSEMYQGYNILNTAYNNIKNISQGEFNLHKAFLDGLSIVSPTVRQYKKAGEIVTMQLQLVSEYKNARSKLVGSLTADELKYYGTVYGNLLTGSLKNLDELATILSDGQLEMNDADRLKSIEKIHTDMSDKLDFLKHFNNDMSVLALQRAKEQNDISAVRGLYGIK
jgi:hypothetical protein